jgi:hypothetical protein
MQNSMANTSASAYKNITDFCILFWIGTNSSNSIYNCVFILISQILTGYQSHQIQNMSHVHTLVVNIELVTLQLH